MQIHKTLHADKEVVREYIKLYYDLNPIKINKQKLPGDKCCNSK